MFDTIQPGSGPDATISETSPGPGPGLAPVPLERRSAGPGERYLVGRLGPRHDPRSGTDAAGGAVDTEIAAGGDGADGGTRPRWKRSGSRTRRWRCSGGTPPSPCYGNPAG